VYEPRPEVRAPALLTSETQRFASGVTYLGYAAR